MLEESLPEEPVPTPRETRNSRKNWIDRAVLVAIPALASAAAFLGGLLTSSVGFEEALMQKRVDAYGKLLAASINPGTLTCAPDKYTDQVSFDSFEEWYQHARILASKEVRDHLDAVFAYVRAHVYLDEHEYSKASDVLTRMRSNCLEEVLPFVQEKTISPVTKRAVENLIRIISARGDSLDKYRTEIRSALMQAIGAATDAAGSDLALWWQFWR